MIGLLIGLPVAAQDADPPAAAGRTSQPVPLCRLPPRDLLRLKGDQADYEVRVLNLPQRRLPESPRDRDRLTIEYQDERFEVAWKDIALLQLFEQRVLDEAVRWMESGQFDLAYEDLVFLRQHDPDWPGLKEAIHRFWLAEARHELKQGRLELAWASLERLRDAAPNHAELPAAYGEVAGRLIEGAWKDRDFRLARHWLDRLRGRWPKHELAATWEALLVDEARQRTEQARQQLEAGAFREARRLADEAVLLAAGQDFVRDALRDAHRRHAKVVVGITRRSARQPAARLDDPAWWRDHGLRFVPAVQRSSWQPDGPEYVSPLGDLQPPQADGTMRLVLTGRHLAPDGQPLTAHDLARVLLKQSGAGTPLEAVLGGLEVPAVDTLRWKLRQRHVRPEALLEGALSEAAAGPFRLVEETPQEQIFLARQTGNIAEVVQRVYPSRTAAVAALRRGEVDLVEAMAPWELDSLRQDPQVEVAAYAAPRLHCLVPNLDRPLLADREFRRGLIYATNRQAILRQWFGEWPSRWGRVAGSVVPHGYAQDPRVQPYPYAPYLAATLLALAQHEQAKRSQSPPPTRLTLTLAHPPDDVARLACRTIARHWAPLGISTRLVEHAWPPPEDLYRQYDLVYAELAVWDPLVDVPRLFDSGILRHNSPFLDWALAQAQGPSAQSWTTLRPALYELHRILHDDATVIPLWEITEHFAFHRAVEGPRGEPLTLYQDILQWQVTPRLLFTGR